MATTSQKLMQIILPKKKPKKGGTSYTDTYDGSGSVASPPYTAFRQNISDLRSDNNSKTILTNLFKNDPDVSASLHTYLTIANTDWSFITKNAEGEIDKEGQKITAQTLFALTRITDYSLGFQLKRSLDTILEEMKYTVILHGAVASELVLNKLLNPSDLRNVDVATIEWGEKVNGVYKPVQAPEGGGDDISLDIPTFMYQFYRRNPFEIYPTSMFVSAINTVVARMQMMNDLYTIMQVTGYPRIGLKLVEEIAVKNAPANIKKDPAALRTWLNSILSTEATKFASVAPDQVYAHFDSLQTTVLNGDNSVAELQIEDLMKTLNSQNQAALKVVATVIGRGESGVNTASVEARVFAMSADSLNKPVSDLMAEILTLAIRLQGYDGYVEFWFDKVEMRPKLELEAQKTMRQSRLLTQLSLGLITDNEFHLKMNGRLAAEGVPELSGTGFDAKVMDTSDVSSNTDPLGRSLTPEDSDSAKSNGV